MAGRNPRAASRNQTRIPGCQPSNSDAYCTYNRYSRYSVSKPQPGIDRSSPEPYYVQLSRLMEAEIDAGRYGVGDRLPGETELCRNFDLARSTVRETLRSLEQKGRIKVVPRRGAFVIDPGRSGWLLQVAEGFFEAEVDHHQRNVETRVLSAKRMPLPRVAADALDLDAGAPGFVLKRLRRLDGQVALLSVNYLPRELEAVVRQSEIMKGTGSLNRVLHQAGYTIHGARRSVEAVAASAELAELLEVRVDTPLMLITSASWGKDGKVFDYYTSWVRSDVVKVTIEARTAADGTRQR